MPNALDAIRHAGKVVGYVRVSTSEQNTARQLDGVHTDKLFVDHVSGKSRDRPQLNACLDFLREDDTLVVHSMDRLARNVEDLRKIVSELVERGVTVSFMKENLTFRPNSNSIVDKLVMTLLGAYAEFERAIMLERQREGIAIARAAGAYRGRPRTMTPEKLKELYRMVDAGEKKTHIAKQMKISRQRVHFYINSRKGKEVENGRSDEQANA